MLGELALRGAIRVLEKTPFRTIQRFGYHFQRNDFYSPLNDCDFLEANRDLWTDEAEPLDIDWNIDGQLGVAREVANYVEELRDVPDEPTGKPGEFYWRNPFWNNADALVQYGLVRSRKPRRVVEIGCGFSSLLLAEALRRNGTPCEVTQIEPYPNPAIFANLPREWVHHQTILQRAPLGIFDTLEAGDILFYDGSHCAKAGSDVNWFFFRVLPRLRPGVLIHLHDIFLPQDYDTEWIFGRGQTWNEQYLLQAFLMNNDRYRVLIANRYLFVRRGEELQRLYRGVQPPYGCSFWMEKAGRDAGDVRVQAAHREGDVRDAYIGDVVEGRSFAEVGGLWGTTNEKISVAQRAGATSLAMIDITPPDGELWTRFAARMQELGVADYRTISGDICEVSSRDDAGNYDVVHCSGVLYHHPNPMLLIESLRKITGEYLILTSAITQETIVTESGSYRIPPSGVIFLPALSDGERQVIGDYWRSMGVRGLGLTEPANFRIDDLGPWWFLPTATSLSAMCEAAGFIVEDSALTWNDNALTLKLRLD